MKIGLVGLGRMGRAIQARLADRGVEVIGWDRDAVAMQAAADNGMGGQLDRMERRVNALESKLDVLIKLAGDKKNP